MNAHAVVQLALLVAVALAVGVLGRLLFRWGRISDVVTLIAGGILAGPVLGLFDGAVLADAVPFVSVVTLACILFEGGLQLPLREARSHAGRALLFTGISFALTTLGVAAMARFALGLSWELGLLLGFAVGASGIVVVLPLLRDLRAPPLARVCLTADCVVGDALGAVLVVSLAGAIASGAGMGSVPLVLAREIVVGAALGVGAGLVVSRVLISSVGYPAILVAILASGGIALLLGGSPYVAALCLGLTLASRTVPPSVQVRDTHAEVSFALRAVLLFYIGLIVPLTAFQPVFLGAAVLVVAAMLLVRSVAAWAVTRDLGEGRDTRRLLIIVIPRGLAAVVISGIPLTMGVQGVESFPVITVAILIVADLATTVGVWWTTPKAASEATMQTRS